MQKKRYDNGDDNDNVISAHDKAVEGAKAGWKIRRATRTGAYVENFTNDMRRLHVQTTKRERGGNIVTVSEPKLVADAALDQFTKPEVTSDALALYLGPNDRLINVTVPKVAVKMTGQIRLKLIPGAVQLLEHLTALNDDRSTYVQWSETEPGGIEVLIRGFYIGPRTIDVVVAGTVLPVTLDASGWMLLTGRIVGPVRLARRGRLVEAQRLLDAIATQARTGRPFNLDRWMADHVEAKKS